MSDVGIEKNNSKTFLGFWIYLMTDIALFMTLFATFAVLRGSTADGPSGKEIFELPYVLTETVLLLFSSFTIGLAMISARYGSKKHALILLAITFILGMAFLILELNEFYHLVNDGHSWRESAFLSSFFTLVGTHGAHIAVGLIWIAFMAYQIFKTGLRDLTKKRLMMLTMFWHFLDVVWIFIFSIVYLLGAS